MPDRLRLLTCTLTSALVVAACDRAPADLREWKPDDHDRVEETPGRAAPPRAKQTAAQPSGSAANPTTTLVEVTWRNQCSPCHGMVGRGDGPQGPMVHAPDLTQVAWQSKVSDQQIAQVIATGKNRMPKFEFPPEVLGGLVARIRAIKGL